MSDTVIKVENLSKQYRLGVVGTGTLSHDLSRWWHGLRGKEDPYHIIDETNDISSKGRSTNVWALRDINFDVKKGEILGVIGKNGAGKSTLLKILSRVTAPTKGTVKAKGRIASLLDVGTGFHPELSGRENVFLNGTILGMTRAEIKNKLDEIVEFSGTLRYIDTPVKRYSTGMRVRLAFAVAAHLESEILIVDEVLAVGDAEFQKKALGKMHGVAKDSGRTILFVSHNMAAIKTLCNKGILLKNGLIDFRGSTRACIQEYLAQNIAEYSLHELEGNISRSGNGKVKFIAFHLENESGDLINYVLTGETIALVFKIKVADRSIKMIDIGFSLHNHYNERLCFLYSSFQNTLFSADEGETLEIRCFIKDFPFTGRKLVVRGRIEADGSEADWPKVNLGTIDVEPGDFYGTGKINDSKDPFLIKGTWDIVK
ncbi:polysaccharide/polyol phosphate ABC transporter ATPase [Flammeovirgaceae bacterium 311]|nr:polysaccharide/polyol phosphate ABC transporter ATPase [Flammeovirgaceae bacterium 311]